MATKRKVPPGIRDGKLEFPRLKLQGPVARRDLEKRVKRIVKPSELRDPDLLAKLRKAAALLEPVTKRPPPKWHAELRKILTHDPQVSAHEAVELLGALDGYAATPDCEALSLPGGRKIGRRAVGNLLSKLRAP